MSSTEEHEISLDGLPKDSGKTDLVFSGASRESVIVQVVPGKKLSVRLEFPQGSPRDTIDGNLQLQGGGKVELDLAQRMIVIWGIPEPEMRYAASHPLTSSLLGTLDAVCKFSKDWELEERIAESSSPRSPNLVAQRVRLDPEGEKLRFEHLVVLVPLPRLKSGTGDLDGYALLYVVTDYDSSGLRQEVSYEVRLSEGTLENHLGVSSEDLARLSRQEPKQGAVTGGKKSEDQAGTYSLDDWSVLAAEYQEVATTIEALNKIGKRMFSQPASGYYGYPPRIDLPATLGRLSTVGEASRAVVYPATEDGLPMVETLSWQGDAYQRLGVEVVDWGLINDQARQSLEQLHYRLLALMSNYPEFFRLLTNEFGEQIDEARQQWDRHSTYFTERVGERINGALTFPEWSFLSSREQHELLIRALEVERAKDRSSLSRQALVFNDRAPNIVRSKYQVAQSYAAFNIFQRTYLSALRCETLLFGVSDLDLNARFTAAEYRELGESVLERLESWRAQTGAKPDPNFTSRCNQWLSWFKRNPFGEIMVRLPQAAALWRQDVETLSSNPRVVPAFLLNRPDLFQLLERNGLGPGEKN